MDKTEQKYHHEKKVYWSLESIKGILGERSFKVSLPNFPLDNCIASSKLNSDNDLEIKFFLEDIYGQEYLEDYDKFGINEKIVLTESGRNYIVNQKSAKGISVSISKPQVLTLTVKNFQTNEDSAFQDKVLRLIVETNEEQTLEIFQTKSVYISGTTTYAGLLEIKIDNSNYHLYCHKNDDLEKSYLIIESLEPLKFETFKKDCDSILLAFGFITGNFHQNKFFYQVIREDNVTLADETKYVHKKDSIISNTPLLNPHKWWRYLDLKNRKDLLKKIPANFQMVYFNKLIEKIKSTTTLQRVVKLILQGNQTKQTLLRAGIYSIALETLTNLVYEENTEKINPIKQKKLSKIIQDKFREIVEEYDSFIDDYGLQIIEAKINDLNKPTNSKKLQKPFELYGIKLTKEHQKILAHRNKFLHGTSPFKETELPLKEFEIANISFKLLFLISCLILKYSGYKGYILNLGDWHNYSHKREIEEHFFKVI